MKKNSIDILGLFLIFNAALTCSAGHTKSKNYTDLNNNHSSSVFLMVGEFKTLSGTVSAITGAQYLTVKKNGGALTLIGKKPGQGFLSLSKNQKVRFTVFPSKLGGAREALNSVLEDEPGLGLSVENSKFWVRGRVHSKSTWLALADVKKSFPDSIELNLKAPTEILSEIKLLIEDALSARALSSSTVEIEGEQIKVYDLSGNSKNKKTMESLAQNWGASLVDGTSRVELRPMIEVGITIAEVKRSKMSQWGLSLPKTYSATIIPSSDLGTFVTQYQGLNIQLHANQEQGFGKIIANPKLICRSGEAARFVAGGEIPIKIMNWKVSDVLWKKYGVILDITPKADLQKAISTRLITEVSLIDEAHKVDGIPGFLTNRIETHFDIRGEKTIALSGLIKNELGRGKQATPLLSSIPILGELFSSQDYKDNSSELIVLVTPRVLSPENLKEPEVNNFWKATE